MNMDTCQLALIAQTLRGLEAYRKFLHATARLGNERTDEPPETQAARAAYEACLCTVETRIHHLGSLLMTGSVNE